MNTPDQRPSPQDEDQIRQWIDHLNLQPHPEGGYYAETYRASESIPSNALPERFAGARSYATGIYFLLTQNDVSHFHRIQSDEMWHFYAGSALTVHMITSNGAYEKIILGPDFTQGQSFQAVVPAGTIFGATVASGAALVGCTVAPGFDFDDFQMMDRRTMLDAYPDLHEIIIRLT